MSCSPTRPEPVGSRATGNSLRILISAEETGGTMSMVETLVKPSSAPTYHSHVREDETFYVVSGTAEVWIDREIFRCEAGDRVFGPRNVFHTYRNVGNTDLKMILVYTPGGFEQSFLDREVMLEAGKDQSEVGRMMLERYGLTRGQLPS
jgi:mannose-6-phosphate isomerase-like protein (cupin superfamily)